MNTTREKIKAMLGRISALTESDKTDIKAMCKEAGMQVTFRKNCADCWRDGLILLAVHYDVRKGDDVLTPSGNFIYHNGETKVIWWYKRHYTELSAMSSDATIVRYMAANPSQKHYSRVESTATAENGTESVEQTVGGETEQDNPENVSEEQNIASNEGVNGEGDNGGKESGNEENE